MGLGSGLVQARLEAVDAAAGGGHLWSRMAASAYAYARALAAALALQSGDVARQAAGLGKLAGARRTAEAWAAAGCALLALLDVGTPVALGAFYALYLRTADGLGRFTAYQWDALACEAALWAIPLAPFAVPFRSIRHAPAGDGECPSSPPFAARLLATLLCVRLHVAGGALCKLTSGCTLWRTGRALEHHLFSQPLPHAGAFALGRLPRAVLRALGKGAQALELLVPALLLVPWQAPRVVGVVSIAAIQSSFALTGNFGVINLLSAATALPALPDDVWPLAVRNVACNRDAWFLPAGVTWALLGIYVMLALYPTSKALHLEGVRRRMLQIPGLRQLIVASAFGRAVNHFALFGRMTPLPRHDLVFERSFDGHVWQEIEGRLRPGDSRLKVTPFLGFLNPRVEWSLWFLTNDNRSGASQPPQPWFYSVLDATRTPAASPATQFVLSPPSCVEGSRAARVRAAVYSLRPAKSRTWWTRERVGLYAGGATAVPPEEEAARKIQVAFARRHAKDAAGKADEPGSADAGAAPRRDRHGAVAIAGVHLERADGALALARAASAISHASRFEADTVQLEAGMAGIAKLFGPLLGSEALGLSGVSVIRCAIGDAGAAAAAIIVGRRPKLEKLSLSYAGIGPKGSLSIAGVAVAHPCLTHLTLDGNPMGDGAAAAVAHALSLGPCTLRAVSLRDTLLGARGIAILAPAAAAGLVRLDVSHNDGVSDDGAKALAAALGASNQKARSLRWLGLERCGISNRGVKDLAEGISSSESASADTPAPPIWFALSDNYASLDALADFARRTTTRAAIATAASACGRQTEASLAAISNQICAAARGSETPAPLDPFAFDFSHVRGGIALLPAALSAGATSFIARDCEATDTALVACLEKAAASTLPTLTSINIAANKLSDDGATALAKAMQRESGAFSRLKHLQLRANPDLGEAGGVALAHASKHRPLSFVDLSECSAGDASAIAWAQSNSVEELVLERACVRGAPAVDALCAALARVGPLSRLRLAGNALAPGAAQRLSAACRSARAPATNANVEVTL